jgi:hypothetical protein
MNARVNNLSLKPFLVYVLLVDCGIALAGLLAAWLLGLRSPVSYGQTIMLIGSLVSAAGAFSLLHPAQFTPNPNNWYRVPGPADSPPEIRRPPQTAAVPAMIAAGALALAGGWTVQVIFSLLAGR